MSHQVVMKLRNHVIPPSAAEEEVVQVLQGRVLRKHAYSRKFLFIDIVYALPESSNSTPLCQYEYASLVIKREEDITAEGAVAEKLPAVIVGDVLRIHCAMVQNVEKYLHAEERPSILITSPTQLHNIEAWNIEEFGYYSFAPQKLNLPPEETFASGTPLLRSMPGFVIQVTHKSIDRVLETLPSTLANLFPSRKFACQESTTSYMKTGDRLVGVWLLEEEQEGDTVTSAEVSRKLIEDVVLRTNIIRSYSGISKEAISVACSPLFSHMIQDLIQQAFVANPDHGITGVRLQINPRSFAADVTTREFENLSVPWMMQGYSHVLSAYQFDGIWMGSIVKAEDIFIGDTRQKKSGVVEVKDEQTNQQHAVICRAQAKLEEIMRRKNWIVDDVETKALHHYKLAIDIGSSPGGWTTFLAQSCSVEKIISVDKGELSLPSPWPANIEYWCMQGEEAIQQLLSTHLHYAPIDFLCCDANIAPLVSLGFLIKALEGGRVAPEARVVITLKNTFSRKDQFEESIQECFRILKENQFTDISLVHLLANTAKETTLTAIYRPNNQPKGKVD